jgi:hypothetical protein
MHLMRLKIEMWQFNSVYVKVDRKVRNQANFRQLHLYPSAFCNKCASLNCILLRIYISAI